MKRLLERIVRKYGFEAMKELGRPCGRKVYKDFVFIYGKYVIKMFCEYADYSVARKYAIPTMRIGDSIVIQPLARIDAKSQKKAYDYFCQLKRFPRNIDLHLDNCAIYKGRPVLIDW